MSDCSQHKKDLYGHTDMKEVAETIGDLNYASLEELLGRLAIKLYKDGLKDRVSGREKLGYCLNDASDKITEAAKFIKSAWHISKPFMKQAAPPLEFGQVYKHKDGYKKVVHAGNVKTIKENPSDWEYVCEKAHDDGDFSYMCSFPYCRCSC